MFKLINFSAVIVLLVSLDAWADQVTLKNGDRLSGRIIKSDTSALSIKSDFAGTVAVQWDAVQEISSTQPLHVTSKDGQVLVGTLTTTAGKVEVDTREAGKVMLVKEAIRAIRSSEEQTAYEAEIERLRNPRLTDLWTGSVDAGLSLARGNAETTNYNLATEAARITSRDKISAHFSSLFAKNKTNGKSQTTANAKRGGIRYDLNLSSRTFAFGFTELESDQFQRLDIRVVLGGGLGRHVMKTERTALDLFGGGAFNKEVFATGPRRSSGELLTGEEFSYQLANRTFFKERAVLYPNLSQVGEYRLTFDSSVITNLNRWLAWHLTLSDRYLSNPLPGTKKNDLLLTTGIRVSFGRPRS